MGPAPWRACAMRAQRLLRGTGAAWPALIFGLLLLLVLPTLVGLAIAATLDGADLVRLLPLPYLISLVGAAVLVSLVVLLVALHARRVSGRLKAGGYGHPGVSRLALTCSGAAFVVTLGVAALIIFGEGAPDLPR